MGSLGYINCAKEISNQAQDMGITFNAVISAAGSGGTYAGLTLGAKLFLPGTRSIGIGVCDDPFAEIAMELTAGAAELLEADFRVTREDIHIHYCIGPGYAIPSAEGCTAVCRLARSEGILTDPVYTGKALVGFFQLLAESRTSSPAALPCQRLWHILWCRSLPWALPCTGRNRN